MLAWGDLSIQNEFISEFEAENLSPVEVKKDKKHPWWSALKEIGQAAVEDFTDYEKLMAQKKNNRAWDSRDVKLNLLFYKSSTDPSEENFKLLQDELTHRLQIDRIFQAAFPHHLEKMKSQTWPDLHNFDCYREYIDLFTNKCERPDDYTFKYLNLFVSECETLGAYPEFLEKSKATLTA